MCNASQPCTVTSSLHVTSRARTGSCSASTVSATACENDRNGDILTYDIMSRVKLIYQLCLVFCAAGCTYCTLTAARWFQTNERSVYVFPVFWCVLCTMLVNLARSLPHCTLRLVLGPVLALLAPCPPQHVKTIEMGIY